MGLSENGESTKWQVEWGNINTNSGTINTMYNINQYHGHFDIPPMVLSISTIHDNQYRSWIAKN
jgi:hypothetical protein